MSPTPKANEATSEEFETGQVSVLLPYLARSSLYETEKPYSTNFDVSEIPGAKDTNHTIQLGRQVVHDLRQQREKFDLKVNGFEFLKSPLHLDRAKCRNHDFVQWQYSADVEAVLRKHFPYFTKIVYLDHQMRKRSPLFPNNPGELVDFLQPASMPHVDFTTRGSFLRMSQIFEEEDYLEKDFDLINVWQVVTGPNNDWPLALCDFTSIDSKSDCVANDVIHEDSVEENGLLFYGSQHRWYYLSDQEVDDLIVFRHSDSSGQRSKAFHAAFDTGKDNVQPRESIEMRFAAFY